MSKRITLKEVSNEAPQILARGDSLMLDEGAPPTFNDLAGALQFALGDGRIWLNDERMVMLQSNILGDLRAKMIEEIGMDRTRERCMQVGWNQGVQLAKLVTKRFNQTDKTAALAAGPRLHTMQGFAKVATRRFEFDVAKQEYLGEFYWYDSAEGTEHYNNFGVCDCPVCWTQVAVPSGFTTTLLGYPVIFRELDCVGQGSDRCLIVGKDAKSWDGDVPELKTFGIDAAAAPKGKPWTPAADLESKPKRRVLPSDIVGQSAAIARTRRLVDRVCAVKEPVLLMGETGTGKEHFARYLHEHGETPKGPFVRVNCSAFFGAPEAENETLFGPSGLMSQAVGGTLFLNDVVALPPAMQAKLALRLQDKGSAKLPYRVVSATGDVPIDAVAAGKLRADLHYFLSLLPIQIPPLRERPDDIPDLIEHFFLLHSARHAKTLQGLAGPLVDVLLRYNFPGNIRELSNMIDRGVIYAQAGDQIDISHVFTGIEKMPQLGVRMKETGTAFRPKAFGEVQGERTLADVESETIIAALNECDWNVSAAARRLGLTRAKLDYRIKKMNLMVGD